MTLSHYRMNQSTELRNDYEIWTRIGEIDSFEDESVVVFLAEPTLEHMRVVRELLEQKHPGKRIEIIY